jgi:hypothetical protein
MSAETDIDILLCYYNTLIEKLNNNNSDVDKSCLSELASQINAVIQGNLRELSTTTQSPIEATMITSEFAKLLKNQEYDDSVVLKDMYQSHAMIFIIIFLILLTIYILI